jgi:membrane-associated phospholipid phosphatase
VVTGWYWVALGYVSYLAVVSLTRTRFARARLPLFIAAAVAWGAFAVFGRTPLSPALGVVVPALLLLVGYWLSGLLFTRPDADIERWLHRVDVVYLTRVLAWYRQAPLIVSEYVELSYLLVYVALPAAATTLVLGGHSDHVERFWTVVLLAEFACYGMLPWIQTRPPRVIEPEINAAPRALLRRLNQGIVTRASIQANTVPSGHAAGAFATALAVGSVMPLAGVVFMILAISIAIATVLGRYHYVVDTVLGLMMAIAVWTLM